MSQLPPIEVRFETSKAREDLRGLGRDYLNTKARIEANPINVGVGGNPGGGGGGRRGTRGPSGAGTSAAASGGSVEPSGMTYSPSGGSYISSWSVPDRSNAANDSRRQTRALGDGAIYGQVNSAYSESIGGSGGFGGGGGGFGGGPGGGGPGGGGGGGGGPGGGGRSTGLNSRIPFLIRSTIAGFILNETINLLGSIAANSKSYALAGGNQGAQASALTGAYSNVPFIGPALSLLTVGIDTDIALAGRQEGFGNSVFASGMGRNSIQNARRQALAGSSFSTARAALAIHQSTQERKNALEDESAALQKQVEGLQKPPDAWRGTKRRAMELLLMPSVASSDWAYSYSHPELNNGGNSASELQDIQTLQDQNKIRLSKKAGDIANLDPAQRQNNLIDSAYDLSMQRAAIVEKASQNQYRPLGGALSSITLQGAAENDRFSADKKRFGPIGQMSVEYGVDVSRHEQNIESLRQNALGVGKTITDEYLYGKTVSQSPLESPLANYGPTENLNDVLAQLVQVLQQLGPKPAGGHN